ncbi:MAG TPA: MMPL family transporter [Solirubrobacterales bacterium]|nr:MMPL family transporter [Solirubrobacterales bacterium]
MLRHPRRVLALAALLLAVLAVVGLDVEGKLRPTSLSVPGTESQRGGELLREHFGESAPFAILLEGPPAALERQGPRLVRALRLDPKVTTLSPWDIGSVEQLRPRPDRALVLADFHVGIDEAVDEVVPRLERTLDRQIQPPVEATQTGYASISRAIQEESIAASERGELIALPILLIVLLLVFRSPVAAAIPLAFGAITVISSRGILYLAADWFAVDAFALTVCTMMGLALGVDYALLMVSRFREELAGGADPLAAAWTTRRAAGRTVAFAGSTLLLSMIVALFIVPGSLLASLAGTLAMVVVLSVLVAAVAGPALLTLLGPNVDRWRIGPAPGEGRSRLMTLVGAALKRPLVASALIGAVVLVLAAPALGLKTGPPSPAQLAEDAPARLDAERIQRAVSPGYEAPFQIVAVSDEGAITDSKDLAALSRWQRRVAALPGVQVVIGPGQIAKRVDPLRDLGNAVLSSEGEIGPVKQLGKLGRNLARAAGGVGELRTGLSEASDGAGLLALGSDRAAEGGEMIATGLSRALNGSQRAVGALDRFAEGSRQLSDALGDATLGALNLKFGAQAVGGSNLRFNGLRRSRKLEKDLAREAGTTLPKLVAPAKDADEQLKAALAQLQAMTTGQADPTYGPALEAVRRASAAVSGVDPGTGAPYAPEYAGLPVELEALEGRLEEDAAEARQVTFWLRSTIINAGKIATAASKLHAGLVKIQSGSEKLADGAELLAKESRALEDGLARLGGGAAALVGGIERLGEGAAALEENLAAGFSESEPLQSGLLRASVQVLSGKARIKRQAGRVRRQTPGIFNSGYFVLSALDGAPPRTREATSRVIDLDHGGQAAAVQVISRYSFNTPGSIALNEKLNDAAAALERESGLRTGVAGGAAQLNDYSDVTRASIPWVVAAITLVTFLVLVLVLRAIPLAAIAVLLNLATVGVAFGILTLLFEVPESWPLGGNEYVDAVGATMIFGVVFGLSIDYAVFLLVRMREHYDREGDNAAAIDFGLEKTARVITGAAAIMMAVFVAFAGAPIATVSQLGVGLTVAVLLDATVVRIVLLPALMLLIGDRVWWFPRRLERVVPKLNV